MMKYTFAVRGLQGPKFPSSLGNRSH